MKYIFGNWKMYLDFDESMILTHQLLQDEVSENTTLAVFPNTIAFTEVEKAVRETSIAVGAQNVAWVEKGAYTGATSAQMFKHAGATYALVGHSERRHIFHETDQAVRTKLEACLDAGLVPVLCVGETAEDKAEGKQEYRLKKQLMSALQDLDLGGKTLLVAYEPVWAISGSGTGEPCTPQDVEQAHHFLKTEIAEYVEMNVPLLYGGSVNQENVVSYISLDSVDGVLVGSASSKYESFSALITAAGNA